MATLKNEDLKVLIEVEDLLHSKLVETNAIKEGQNYYFDENDKEYDLWCNYWNIIERFIADKKKANKKSAEYNKRELKYHRISNNLYQAKKNKNWEKMKYWEQKLKELKRETKKTNYRQKLAELEGADN